MRFPCFKFTIRRMMIAVAIVGTLIWGAKLGFHWWDNWNKCRILVAYYRRLEAPWLASIAKAETTIEHLEQRRQTVAIYMKTAERCAAIRRKYERMQWRPWLDVPDVEPPSEPIDATDDSPQPMPPRAPIAPDPPEPK